MMDLITPGWSGENRFGRDFRAGNPLKQLAVAARAPQRPVVVFLQQAAEKLQWDGWKSPCADDMPGGITYIPVIKKARHKK
jgi:hypothetical protein